MTSSQIGIRMRETGYSRLGLKLVLFVGFVLLAYTATFLFFVLRSERRKTQSAVQGEALRLSETIRKSIEFELLEGRRESVQNLVEAVTQQKGIEEVSIYNKQGQIVVSNRRGKLGMVLDKDSEACSSCHREHPPATFVTPDLETSRIFESADGHRVLHKVEPLYNLPKCYVAPCHIHSPETKVLGMMDVSISLAEAERALATDRSKTVVFATLLFVIVSAAIGMFVHVYVYIPIRKLAAATRAVAAGDLDQKVEISRRDDMGVLAESFNRMTGDLKQAREEGERFHERLERSVQEATAELQDKTMELTTIYEGIADGILLLDRDMVVVSANRGFGRIFDVDVSRLAGQKCIDAMGAHGEMCAECPATDALKTGRSQHKVSVLRRPDNGSLTLDVWAFPVRNVDGEVAQVIEYIKDVTEEVALEEHVRDIDKMASIGQVAA